MKKFLLIIFVTFTPFSYAIAEERVNLICNADVSVELDSNKTTSTSGTKGISIFPESKKYNFQGFTGTYSEEGNFITWRNGDAIDGNIIDDYYFDRVTGEFMDIFGFWIDGAFKPKLVIKYKCKKTEVLF